MRSPPINLVSALAVAGALLYPVLVWIGLSTIPPGFFVWLGVALIGVRVVGAHRLSGSPVALIPLVAAAALPVSLLWVSPVLAARIYPVAISLAVAATFALSLRYPPSVIARIARLSEPDLPPRAIAYTTQVTRVWIAFLLGNAVISLWTAIYGTLAQWTLWNGLLSYLAMGTLFAGEYLIRRRVRV